MTLSERINSFTDFINLLALLLSDSEILSPISEILATLQAYMFTAMLETKNLLIWSSSPNISC